MKVDWKTLCIAMISSIVITTLFGLLLTTVIFPHSPWDCYSPSSKISVTFAEACNPTFNIHYVPLSQVIMGAFLIGAVLTMILYSVIILYKKQNGKNT
jgi:hypothetical protein